MSRIISKNLFDFPHVIVFKLPTIFIECIDYIASAVTCFLSE